MEQVKLTFRPFAMLGRDELRAELRYWQDMGARWNAGQLSVMQARRHAERCKVFLRRQTLAPAE